MKIWKRFVLFIFILSFFNLVYSQSAKYEAEYGILTGTLQISNSTSGFSGTGYVGNFTADGDKLTLNFNLTTAGIYNLYITYYTPYGQKTNDVSVNGNTISVTFPLSNSFKELLAGKVMLHAGANSVAIIKNWGWFYVDCIRIEPNIDPVTSFNIPTTPVSATMPEAVSEYQYLYDNFGKKIFSGVMYTSETEWLKTNTGKYPALVGLDFMDYTRSYSWVDKTQLVKQAKDYSSRHGLVAICWHWRDPSRLTEAFYSANTSFDVSQVTNTASNEYIAMVKDIDTIANYLKVLQNAKIPVLFRPLHESSGEWFWWGAKGAAPSKALWNLLFDRLTNYHGLKNLIWVWTTDASSTNLDWYPGDSVVDILGMDIYASTGDYSSQYLSFNKIRDDFKGKKLITLSENGVIPDPDNLVADQAAWSWFMVWYGSYVEDGISNPLSVWQKVMNHNYVVTLDEMPDISNYHTQASTSWINDKPLEKFNVNVNLQTKELKIQPTINTNYNLFVYDISGRLLKSKFNNIANISFSLNNIKAGCYFVEINYVIGGQNQKFTKKIIITN